MLYDLHLELGVAHDSTTHDRASNSDNRDRFGFEDASDLGNRAPSLIFPSSFSSAAWSYADQEPAAFASMYPDRHVLNGGALTPAGRMGLERPGDAAPVFGAGHIYNRHGYR